MAGWEEYERGGAHAQGSCNSNQGGWGAAGSLGSCSELERSYDEYWLPEVRHSLGMALGCRCTRRH